MTSLLLHKCRIALGSASTKIKESLSALRVHTRRALWRSRDGWRRLTAGMEIEELWTQFKAEAGESSRVYEQDVKERPGDRERSWKQPFKILATLFWSVLKRLSPARRLFLLATLILAFLSIVGFHFLLFTRESELRNL